jgi:hypothetical protein
LTTVVNITLVQKNGEITVRSDAIGEDEEVLSLGLQIVQHLLMVELNNPGRVTVEMPTLSISTH